ncbi:hypothetical protein INT48_005652 [Thamnidium elegans]|uniref:Homeobox domain-containing protein n=1 Tax=Thamnidium elegans TaxID=101142 RepID=A0A8H7VUJ5_9FUNG|nr:hypothetical protein INT48_005652 [Thamnidium elegans]
MGDVVQVKSRLERPAVLDISNLLNTHHHQQKSPSLSPSLTSSPATAIKAKRRRANAKQLEVLNRVFDRTFFPSTQMRAELGRQLGMSPRTVQIWFQNRRQAMRTRERQRLIRLRNNSKSTNKSNMNE